MTPAGRLAATIEILEALAEKGRPADQVASIYFKNRRYIGSKDRRWIAESVWRVLRRQSRLDWLLNSVDVSPIDARARVLADLVIEGGTMPDAEMFQGVHAATPPDALDRRMMERLCKQSLFHRDMPLWVKGEYPEWVEPRLQQAFGDDFLREIGAMRDEAPMDLRVNTLKATREQAIAALAAEGIVAIPTPHSPLGLRLNRRVALVQVNAWRTGLVEVQDEGSQLVALLADVKPGMAVVDYCAGAGGKTLALAAAMGNSGRLIACDVAEWRVDRAQDRLRRAGVHNVTRRVISGESDKWIKRNAAAFDRVLVDAPCSGSGTWRRNPDAKWHMTPEDIAEITVSQATILKSAARLVKPGGRLIYATCSVFVEENEAQVETFLAANANFQPVPVPLVWAENSGTPCPVPGPWLRLSPLSPGTDGFFCAVLEKKSEVVVVPSV